MNRFPLLLACLWILASPSFAQEVAPSETPPSQVSAETEEGFLPLFDGKLLTHWEGKAYWFRIEDKAIVAGRLTERIPHNFFLCTTKKFSDFELRLQVKVVGEGVNAGIQVRSKRVSDSDEVSGYQADVGAVASGLVWGALYDESRRNKMLTQPDQQLLSRLVRKDDWNDYLIRCQGPKVELFVNGTKTTEYVEEDDSIPREGVIGLQIHSGPPSEAWYRNIRIKTL